MSDPRASAAVHQAVQKGLLAPVTTLQCVDCGAPATAYDHFKGYAQEHWLDVEAVCDRHNSIRSYERPRKQSDQAAIVLRLPTDLIAALDTDAREECRSRSSHIEWILREHCRDRGHEIKEDEWTYVTWAA